jgi:hypothetical protein
MTAQKKGVCLSIGFAFARSALRFLSRHLVPTRSFAPFIPHFSSLNSSKTNLQRFGIPQGSVEVLTILSETFFLALAESKKAIFCPFQVYRPRERTFHMSFSRACSDP